MGEKRSGWFYVFVSCGVLLLGGVIVVGVGAFMTIRWAEDLKDPERRTAKAHQVTQKVMGVDTLPEGYHAEVSLRAPFGFGTTSTVPLSGTLVLAVSGTPGPPAPPPGP